MYKALAADMRQLRENYPQFVELIDYFRDELAEFLDAPIVGEQRRNICARLESVVNKIYPVAANINNSVGDAVKKLQAFETFLTEKRKDRQDDWTDLKKRTLKKYTDYVARTRPELEAMQRNCSPIENYVKDAIAHCKQPYFG